MVIITALAALGSYVAASAFGAAIGIAGVTGTLALAAIGLATNVVLGMALNALTPKPSLGGGASGAAAVRGYQVNSKGSALDHQIIYGKVRVGGVILYDEATGTDNKYLHRIIGVAGHEVTSFDEIYINDEIATIDGNGNVTSPSRYSGKVRIKLHLGASDQLADTFLDSASAKWTPEHRLRGIAYMYVRFAFDADVFPNGVPVITATVKGKKVYNPSTGLTVWSDNPALCLRDYLTTSSYGLGEVAGSIDDTLVIASAVVCNETNTIAGTTRYTCNGAFTTAVTPYDMINSLLTSMGGSLWYSQGKWRMKPSYWTTPVLFLNEDDLRSPVGVSTRHSRRDNFNAVKGTFRGEETNWQVTDYPEVTNAAFVTADNGQVSVVDIDLPFTDNSIEARRISRIALESNRQQLMVSASFGLRALGVQVGDNIYLTNSRFGWVNKEFQVISWTFGLTDGLDLQVEMMLKETAESVFDEIDDGVVYERDNTNLLSAFDVPIPSLDAAVVLTSVNEDGTTIPSINFSWSVVEEQLVDHYDFQWKPSTDTLYSSVTITEPNFTLSPALSGIAYDYRVRSVNTLGVNSIFVSSVSPASTGNDSTTPNPPTSLVATGGYSTVKLTWTAPTTNTDSSPLKDLFQYRIFRGTSTNPTTLVGRVSGESFTDGGLNDDTTYYYRIVAQDFTGNVSTYSLNKSVTTSLAPVGADGADGADGPRGAGRWNIGVTTLPTTSSGANTDFVATIGQPVDKDQAWFYTGTVANPTSQGVWIYNAGATVWVEQNEVIDGNLIVSGTVTANAMNANSITAENGAIADLAVSTLKVAGDSITVTNFVDFADKYGAGPYTFSTNVSMAYAGDIVAIVTIRMFGSSSGGSTANYSLYVDGTLLSGISYTGSTLLGLHTLSGSKSVSSGSRNITVTVSNISGIFSPSADCQLTIFRRYR